MLGLAFVLILAIGSSDPLIVIIPSSLNNWLIHKLFQTLKKHENLLTIYD